MKLLKEGDIWYVSCNAVTTAAIPKAAGFRKHTPKFGGCVGRCNACKHGLGKVWWTDIPINARLLSHYADEEVLSSLRETSESLTSSSSSSSSAVLRAPEGKDYLPYQKAGIEYANRKGSCLIGDEQGLGKTIQAIGVINSNPYMKRVLVIAPPSLRTNWANELKKWLVDEWRVLCVHKTKDALQFFSGGELLPGTERVVLVMSYTQITGATSYIHDTLMAIKWDLMIADEVHLYKNPSSKRSQAMYGRYRKDNLLKPGLIQAAERVLLLTGTALPNRPIELWPIVRELDPKGLGRSFFGYAVRYCSARKGRWGWDFGGASNLTELRESLRASFMVRRLKADVLTDLPPKRRQIVTLDSDAVSGVVESQVLAYQQRDETEQELLSLMEEADIAGCDEEFKDFGRALKEAKATAFKELAKERKAVAIAKIPYIIDHVKNVLESTDSSIIVFAHHKHVVSSVAEALKTNLVITGQTPAKSRQSIVDAFQAGENRVLVANIVAAGVGLTLTKADVVVFGEVSWVPADLLQAEDRAHRIGQNNSVLVQYLVFDRSIDAKMLKTIIKKMDVISKTLDKGTGESDAIDRSYMLYTKDRSEDFSTIE